MPQIDFASKNSNLQITNFEGYCKIKSVIDLGFFFKNSRKMELV